MPIYIHGKLVQVCAFRDWEDKGAFKPGLVGIVEFLVNGSDGDLVLDAGLHLYRTDLQRREDIRPRRMWMRPGGFGGNGRGRSVESSTMISPAPKAVVPIRLSHARPNSINRFMLN
jgi:hypothetical protein